MFYDKILSPLPLLRSMKAEKTLFLSLRILLINIATLIVFLLLTKSVGRVHNEKH